jgi:hypothetical protein
MAAKGKVLVLVSSGHGLPLKDGKVYAGAGYYLNELTVPVRALMKGGYEITFANPKGNTPQLDVNSAIAQFFGGDEAKLQDYRKFHDSLTGLKNPTRISDVIAPGLNQYHAVFVPGGHGPMTDLLDDPDAGSCGLAPSVYPSVSWPAASEPARSPSEPGKPDRTAWRCQTLDRATMKPGDRARTLCGPSMNHAGHQTT